MAALSIIGLAPPAQASPISIGGDSSFRVTSQSSVSTHYPALGTSVTASETLTYQASLLGVPLPATAYYTLSYPWLPFATPTLLTANAPLVSTNFNILYDPYMGKSAYVVLGKSDFWGAKDVYLKGSGKTDYRATGYVHGGTGTGHQIDANSVDYISVR